MNTLIRMKLRWRNGFFNADITAKLGDSVKLPSTPLPDWVEPEWDEPYGDDTTPEHKPLRLILLMQQENLF
jgi:hypothetical protein